MRCRPVVNRDVLLLHVEVERPVTAVTPDPVGLCAVKRRGQVAHIFGIHPDHTRLQRVREPQRPCQIMRPQIPCQPLGQIIGDVQRVCLVAHRDGGEAGAETLLLRDAFTGGRIGEQDRRDRVAVAVGRGAGCNDGSTFRAGEVEIAAQLVTMYFVDQGPTCVSRSSG